MSDAYRPSQAGAYHAIHKPTGRETVVILSGVAPCLGIISAWPLAEYDTFRFLGPVLPHRRVTELLELERRVESGELEPSPEAIEAA